MGQSKEQKIASKLDPRKKYRQPVISNWRTISAISTKKLFDLLKNNCVGESGREYCEQTIRDILAWRGVRIPKENTSEQATWNDCLQHAGKAYSDASHGLFTLQANSVFVQCDLKNAFNNFGIDYTCELASSFAANLYQIYRDEQDQKCLDLCLSEFN